MTIPANPILEAAPYGAQPVLIVTGAQGGPYFVPDATHGIQVVVAGSNSTSDGTGARRVLDPGGTACVPGVANHALNNSGGANSWDMWRNNFEATLLASASRTVTTNSADQINYNGTKLLLLVNVSVVGTGSITPSIQVKDPVSGNYFTIWTAAAAIVTAGTFAYYLEAGGAAGGSFTERLLFGLGARTWRLVMTHNNANAITYSAAATVSQ